MAIPGHPEPKKITVFNSTTFGKNVPTVGTSFFEWDAIDPIDFMRSRMRRTWWKPAMMNQGYFFGDDPRLGGSPISLVPNQNEMAFPASPYEERLPVLNAQNQPISNQQKEKATIKVDLTRLGLCGTQPGPAVEPPLTARNKWLFVIEGNRTNDHGSPVNPTTLQPHGIVPTFDKLRIDPVLGQADGNAKAFYDHVFQYESPLSKKEIGDKFFGSITVPDAEIKSVYSFFIQPYETITRFSGSDSVPESILPSLYSFLTMTRNTDPQTAGIIRGANGRVDQGSIDTVFERHATLEKLIDETRVETEVVYNRGRAITTTDVSKGQYFDKYAYAYTKELKDNPTDPRWKRTTTDTVSLEERFRNQIIPSANLDLFSTFEDVVSRFPMRCDISFSTDSKNSELLKVMEDAKLTTMLIKDFVDGNFASNVTMDFNFIATKGGRDYPLMAGGLPFEPKNYQEAPFKTSDQFPAENIASGSLDCWDMTAWATSLIARQQQGGGDDVFAQVENGVFMGDFNREIQENAAPINSINRHLGVLAFTGKFNQMKGFTNDLTTPGKTRTWKDMVGGTFNGQPPTEPKQAYRETIFYKVEKWEGDANGAAVGTEPIQNFYFPNSTKVQDYKFTDTQVKYGKRYIYKIFAFEMVFGTKYWYQRDAAPTFGAAVDLGAPPGGSNLKHGGVNGDGPLHARICIITEPSVKLIKVPYYQKEVIMMDQPPVWPDVEVVPYRGVEDKLVFWLRGNSGNYKLNPIIIEPWDQISFNEIRVAQELTPTDPVQFSSDDHPRAFEVFRMETKPSKYADFMGSSLGFMDTKANIDQVCKYSTTGEWVDTIKPNQKYYYTFRTLDNHGHISNPSPVYELEMVHDGYAPFLLRKVYFLDDKMDLPQVPAKSFSKYIHIKPAYAQGLLNKELSGLIPPPTGNDVLSQKNAGDGSWVKLGMAKQSLWEQKLKVRIISKKTGKRIDVNIKFKHKVGVQSRENNKNNNLC